MDPYSGKDPLARDAARHPEPPPTTTSAICPSEALIICSDWRTKSKAVVRSGSHKPRFAISLTLASYPGNIGAREFGPSGVLQAAPPWLSRPTFPDFQIPDHDRPA